MMIKDFFTKEPVDLTKKSVTYNFLANFLNAAVSVLLLFFVTRSCGLSKAGIFSIGFSTAQMMLTVGQFGMRNYQASDVTGKYTQSDYTASRVISCLIMMTLAVCLVAAKGYYPEKALILLTLCLLKVTDAFDDVYGGYYQLRGRLDISGKMQLVRILLYSSAFVVTVVITKSPLAACVLSFAVSLASLVVIVGFVKDLFPEVRPVFRLKRICRLMWECFPLCVSAFLVLYMGNAPKYSIDAYMPSEYQAVYNYLFMPCYVICLFMSFVLQPLLVKMSKTWVRRRFSSFKKICLMIFSAAVVLSLAIITAGHFLGCPLLGWFYSVDLNGYEYSFTILLTGGAAYALSIITNTVLTVMRYQYITMAGHIVSSVIVTFTSRFWVPEGGIIGAAYSYLVSAICLFAVLFASMLAVYAKETAKNHNRRKNGNF